MACFGCANAWSGPMRISLRRREPEPHSLVGAYALDAIAGKDLVRFERHLTRCAQCAGRLRELREATACLGAGPVIAPPQGLVERAIAVAARTPQLGRATRRRTARQRQGRARRPSVAQRA